MNDIEEYTWTDDPDHCWKCGKVIGASERMMVTPVGTTVIVMECFESFDGLKTFGCNAAV